MSLWIMNGSVWNEATGSIQKQHVKIEDGSNRRIGGRLD